jgi:polyhydroxybutyrate depolymerase
VGELDGTGEQPAGHGGAGSRLTRRAVLVAAPAAVAAAVVAAPGAGAAAPTGKHRRLASGRTYWLSGTGQVLVIGLHGSGLTAANCNTTFWQGPAGGWQAHAAQRGYVLALGEATAGGWNVGGGWRGGSQDDMQYLVDLVEDATAVAGAAFTAVFVAGFSAGGAMAWRAACERPDLFAGCGSASGWAPVYPTRPIDCLHYHGTGDTAVPIRGGAGTGGFVFPAAVNEAKRAPRGSRVVLYPTGGGHATPGWAAADLWGFWTVDRNRP